MDFAAVDAEAGKQSSPAERSRATIPGRIFWNLVLRLAVRSCGHSYSSGIGGGFVLMDRATSRLPGATSCALFIW